MVMKWTLDAPPGWNAGRSDEYGVAAVKICEEGDKVDAFVFDGENKSLDGCTG